MTVHKHIPSGVPSPSVTACSRPARARASTLLAMAALAAVSAAPLGAAPDPALPFRNPDLPLEPRIADLVGRLTPGEKASLVELEAPAIERLGIGAFNWWSEAGHGVGRAGRATMFPQTIAMAATWNDDLMHRVASAIGDEARAKHNENPNGRYRGLTLWSPCINLTRDPRWGRIEETYGEDPLLTARMGMAYVRGVQGDNPRYLKTAATPKHFAVHSQERGRAGTCFEVTARDLREYYLPAFRACLVDAGAQSVMAAFSGINGTPCAANRWLLTDLLRKEWGFDGAVVTDWGCTANLQGQYRIATNAVQAAGLSLGAGVDVLCEHSPWRTNVLNALASGRVTQARIDEAVTRGLRVRFRLGEFDPPERVPYTRYGPEMVGSATNLALALELSRQSIVLLKNGPVPGRADPAPLLPLDGARLDSIAVIGSHADRPYLGAYSGQPAAPVVTPFRGMAGRLGTRTVLRGATWTETGEKRPGRHRGRRAGKTAQPAVTNLIERQSNIEEAVRAASLSDVAVVCLGLNPRIENEGHDRDDMNLPPDQQELIERVFAANPATVVVLINGGPVTIPWIQEHVPAIVEAWYPGEQGGNAIADVLLGDRSPAGRLPMTFYAAVEPLPPLNSYELARGRTYLYLKEPPLYAFGHGLSYTKFDYSNLRLAPRRVPTNGVVTVSVDVTNAGACDGDEVVQLYVRDVEPAVPVPALQLRGYRRLPIRRGEKVRVDLRMAVADLALWDEPAARWRVEPGEFEAMVGASSADIRCRQRFTVVAGAGSGP